MKIKYGFFLITVLILNISLLPFVVDTTEKKDIVKISHPKVSSPPNYATKDTYVNTYHPTENYGGENWLYAGYYLGGDFCDAFFYFPLSGVLLGTKAEISLHIWSVGATMNFTVYLIEASWEELGMTFMNEPSFGPVITNLIVSSETFYIIDVSRFITGRTSISICLHCETRNYVDEYVIIDSREDLIVMNRPQIIWDGVYGEFSVKSPEESDSWNTGKHTIEWKSYGAVSDYVDIKLYKGSKYIEDIDERVDNEGEYDWTISAADNYNGDDYKIKIVDYYNEEISGSSDKFEINYRSMPDLTIVIGIIIIAGIAAGIVVVIFVLRKYLISKKGIQKPSEEKQPPLAKEQKDLKQMDVTKCQMCGSVLRPGSNFCENCGHKLTT